MYKNEVVIPTCLSCSQGGNIIVIGFTDDSIRFVDLRIKNTIIQELEGGHSDMIKAIKLSDDGMMCLSASSDATLRLWDIG